MSFPSRFFRHSTRSIPRSPRAILPYIVRFSQCPPRLDEAPPSNEDSKPGSVKDRRDGKSSQKGRRLVVPALALFALTIPAGWYLKNRYGQDQEMRLAGPQEFARYTLVGKGAVSSTCAIFRLMPTANVALDLDDPDCERAITSVQFKQPQLQIARAYTLLPQQQGQHMDELRFLIRREQKGEVSNFLHRLPINTEIETRGLHSEYILPKDVKSVAFLAGGTGIAPALQVADILEGEADMHILWTNRKREDCIGGQNDTTVKQKTWSWWWGRPSEDGRNASTIEKNALVLQLDALKKQATASTIQESRLLVDYYVDEEGTMVKPQDLQTVLRSLSHSNDDRPPGRKILFVSGPEGFINHWAGPKQWIGGREVQGPVKGVVSTIELDGWEVVKL